MKQWQVFERGNLYRVGRYYQTWLRRRWKIQWWIIGSSHGSHVYQVGFRDKACEEAKDLNRREARGKRFDADHWKTAYCEED